MSHYDPAYFRSATDPFETYTDWMKFIRDDVMLSELAIPGSHDTSTFNIDDEVYTTQAINFKDQLRFGVRAFDIRFKHSNNKFELYHAHMKLNLQFDDFLDSVDNFLRDNPSETVLFRLSKEQNDTQDNTRTRKETLDWYLSNYANTFEQTTENKQLGDVRGKFIMISWDEEFLEYGISKQVFDIQDNYILNNQWDLYDKWIAVRSHLKKASNGSKSQFYMNYISGAVGVYPYFVASGHSSRETTANRLATGLTTPTYDKWYPDFPRVGCVKGICSIVFEGTNILTRNMLKKRMCTNRTVGVIMCDFPGTSLIAEIINNNFNYNLCDNDFK